jgi:hypothetical protein
MRRFEKNGDLVMIRGYKSFYVVTLVLAGALPAAADVTTMSCGDFMALDAPGKTAAAGEMLAWMDTSANSATIGSLVGKYTDSAVDGQWKPEELVIEVEGHCSDASPTTGIFARLIEHS